MSVDNYNARTVPRLRTYVKKKVLSKGTSMLVVEPVFSVNEPRILIIGLIGPTKAPIQRDCICAINPSRTKLYMQK